MFWKCKPLRLKNTAVFVLAFLLLAQLLAFIVWTSSRDSDNVPDVLNLKQGLQYRTTVTKHGTLSNRECTKKLVNRFPHLNDLVDQVKDDPEWKWIINRIEYHWEHWIKIINEIKDTHNILNKQTKKRVLVVPGVLKITAFATNASITSGGPLGDLYQWSDVITALHILGHNVTLVKQFYHVARGLRYNKYYKSDTSRCPKTDVDLIFIDINAMKTMPRDVIDKYGCKFRVLDAYGTEAMYNDISYSLKHGYLSLYGQLGIHLKQFYTFYPHTPDNSFMGFTVVPAKGQERKENFGLLYGKDNAYFKGKESFLGALMASIPIHCTLSNTTGLPTGIINHGVLNRKAYHKLLSKAKYFIGVGLPLESTGVMEALAYGCIIINPKFSMDSQHILQIAEKPTTRLLTSQVPYLEDYIGPPHVYTLDINNITAVETMLKSTYSTQVPLLIPYPFTTEGFLNRLNKYITYQDFCVLNYEWSPSYNWKQIMSKKDQSCVKTCKWRGLVCEPTFFPLLNTEEVFKRFNITCRSTIKDGSVYHPSYHPISGKCVLQSTAQLFSCAGSHTELIRICPCREIVRDMA